MQKPVLNILSCLILGAFSAGPGSASEVSGLEIQGKFFDQQTSQLRYELWNESAKTVTAWRLSLARSDSHGHAQRSILDQDFFDSPTPAEPDSKLGPIAPGTIVTARWRLDIGQEDPGLSALSLKVSAVVFEDLTWQGDPEAVAVILEGRVLRMQEFAKVLADLEHRGLEHRSGQEWTAILQRTAKRLEREGAEVESAAGSRREAAAVLSATKLELARWLEDASREIALSTDPGAAVDSLTGSLRERFDLGSKSTPDDDGVEAVLGTQIGGER